MLDSNNKHSHNIDNKQTHNIAVSPEINFIKPLENLELIPLSFYSDMAKFISKSFITIACIKRFLDNRKFKDPMGCHAITDKLANDFFNYQGMVYDYDLYLIIKELITWVIQAGYSIEYNGGADSGYGGLRAWCIFTPKTESYYIELINQKFSKFSNKILGDK
jgi:hypothetical protein